MSRGDRHWDSVRDDPDREDFLKTLGAAVITNRHKLRRADFTPI